MKKLLSILLATATAVTACAGLAACKPDGPSITVWAPAASIEGYKELVSGFKEANPDYAGWDIKFQNQEEGDVQGKMTDPTVGPNIFFFPSDHFVNFKNKLKCLQPLGTYAADVKTRDSEDSVNFVTRDSAVYAFPATDDNGYFLWYDSTMVTTEQDTAIQNGTATLDDLIGIAKAKGNKRILFNVGNGYYAISFFIGMGCTMDYTDDTLTTYQTDTDTTGAAAGTAYAYYLSAAVNGSGDSAIIVDEDPNAKLGPGFAAGTAFAGIGGSWMTAGIEKEMTNAGKDFSKIKTAVLPKFNAGTVAAPDWKPMGSFTGSKYCGVNSTKGEDEIKVSLAFANYMTNKDGQLKRYQTTHAGPTNKDLNANNTSVMQDTVLATYRKQKSITNGWKSQKDQPGGFWDGYGKNYVKKILEGTISGAAVQTELTTLANSLRG